MLTLTGNVLKLKQDSHSEVSQDQDLSWQKVELNLKFQVSLINITQVFRFAIANDRSVTAFVILGVSTCVV